MNNKEDKSNGVSIDNYVGILAIVMVLVHLSYAAILLHLGAPMEVNNIAF